MNDFQDRSLLKGVSEGFGAQVLTPAGLDQIVAAAGLGYECLHVELECFARVPLEVVNLRVAASCPDVFTLAVAIVEGLPHQVLIASEVVQTRDNQDTKATEGAE